MLHDVKRALLLFVAVAGCNEYRAGSFTEIRDRWPGTHVALPCVDVAVAPRRDPNASQPVVQYSFGNRCEHDATLDLGAAHVVARYLDGHEQPLVAFDPDREIHAVTLPARIDGSETIAYAPARAAMVAQLCVDVGAIDRSGAATVRWVCTAWEGAQ